MPTAFITGVTGQDGSYLAELLLQKNYQVVGLVSGKYNIGFENIENIKQQLTLVDGDLLDIKSLEDILDKHQPDEIYNLAGLTFIPASWEKPTLTLDINALGVSRLLELIAKKYSKSKFYQASSSKIFGNPVTSPQDETTPVKPLDPYSISKAAAHYLTQTMRTHFGIFSCNGILFNHESERRGAEFVSRKITQTAVKIKLKQAEKLELGDLDAKQDWGYAPDYVEAMWLMLQQDTPDDYVIASGEHHTVADICRIAFAHLDLNYQDYVVTDNNLIRQEKITSPLGNPAKAKKNLNWQPKTKFEEMINKMVDYDLKLLS